MAYSRWAHSRFYTFWAASPDADIDKAIFEVMDTGPILNAFTAKELRENYTGCLAKVIDDAGKNTLSLAEQNELLGYMKLFLKDVDKKFGKDNKDGH